MLLLLLRLWWLPLLIARELMWWVLSCHGVARRELSAAHWGWEGLPTNWGRRRLQGVCLHGSYVCTAVPLQCAEGGWGRMEGCGCLVQAVVLQRWVQHLMPCLLLLLRMGLQRVRHKGHLWLHAWLPTVLLLWLQSIGRSHPLHMLQGLVSLPLPGQGIYGCPQCFLLLFCHLWPGPADLPLAAACGWLSACGCGDVAAANVRRQN